MNEDIILQKKRGNKAQYYKYSDFLNNRLVGDVQINIVSLVFIKLSKKFPSNKDNCAMSPLTAAQ